MAAQWSREAIEALGPTTTVPTVASVFGIAPDTVYDLIRRDEWPTRVLHLGRKIKIPTHDLVALLYPETPVRGTGAGAISESSAHIGAVQATANRILNAVPERLESG